MESLGFYSFLGILLVQTQSTEMNLLLCIITVFSISLLCYVVADFDSVFSGFFRVDVSILAEVICRLQMMYDMARMNDTGVCGYPAKGQIRELVWSDHHKPTAV